MRSVGFNPYERALAALAHEQVVVCVPITADDEPSWAVASYRPSGFTVGDVRLDEQELSKFDSELLGLWLIRDARRHLRAQGVRMP